MKRSVVAGLLTVFCLPAMAQSPSSVQAVCESKMAPAYAKATPNATLDCGCVARFLTGRYGASDATVAVRIFAAAAGGSEVDLKAAMAEIGPDRVRAVLNMAGNFQSLGRDIDQACPAGKKP